MILCLYFTYHLFYGPRSYPYLQAVKSENIKLSADLAVLQERERLMTDKVVKLRPETLDADLLKERARTMLGYVEENEIIVIEE